MTLSDAQAKEIIQSPKNSIRIEEVRDQESSLRVFTEEMSATELLKESYWPKFLNHLEKRIEKKYQRLVEFFRFPLPVVGITDAILNDFYKVFEGKNRFFAVNSPDDITDLREWIVANDPETWVEEEGREVFRNKPSNIVVVDRDEEGTPYLISVGLDRLVDAWVKDESGELAYIVFRHSKKTRRMRLQDDGELESVLVELYSVYDSERYRVYEYNNGSGNFRKIIDSEHNLGYCPAHLFVKTPANSHNWLKRRTPFGQSLSKLEDWTTFDIFRNYTDYYAPFPVTESPISKCPNVKCKNGKQSDEQVIDGETGETRTIWTDCPVCKKADKLNLIGPGTHIGIKVQADKNAEDGSGKFNMYFPDTDKMKYIPEKLDDLEIEVRYKTVGISSLLDDQAVNEIQARGSFASMDNILLRTKEELDFIYSWIIYTVGGLYYPDSTLSVEANYGTEWYLVSEEQLQGRFEEAKRIGLPHYEQAAIFDQIIETKYKGNSTKILRQKMLFKLEPLPLYTQAEAVQLFKDGAITREELNLKLNFYNFIQRFEEEQTAVTEFGSSLPMDRRLVRIMEIIDRYNSESLAKFPAIAAPITPVPGTTGAEI